MSVALAGGELKINAVLLASQLTGLHYSTRYTLDYRSLLLLSPTARRRSLIDGPVPLTAISVIVPARFMVLGRRWFGCRHLRLSPIASLVFLRASGPRVRRCSEMAAISLVISTPPPGGEAGMGKPCACLRAIC